VKLNEVYDSRVVVRKEVSKAIERLVCPQTF